MRPLTVILLTLAGAATTAVAAPGTPSLTSGSYWRGYVSHSRALITAPARWKAPQWITAGAVTATGIALYAADEELRTMIRRNPTGTKDDVFGILNHTGDGRTTLPLLAALYAGGKLTRHETPVRAALAGLESFVLANLATQSLKHLLQRHRPYKEDGRAAWDGPSLTEQYKSFPSGHTTAAFSVASALAGTWDTPVAYISCYGIATGAGIARMYFDKHWASDVFAGAVIGTVTGHALSRYHRTGRHPGISFADGKLTVTRSF